jgi:peptidoglycan hydrolase-like protein with peptidoglycan-binding domain
MERRHFLYGTRAAGVSLMACLALLCVPAAGAAANPGNTAGEGASRTSELLARGAGYAQLREQAAVRALQRRLRTLGHRPGPVDGLYGPLTESAVEEVQRDSGLSVDGVVGPQTRRVLNIDTPPLVPGAGYGRAGGSPRVRAIQRSLRSAGQRPGAVDGLYGPRTVAAVARFQRTAGHPASGVLSTATAQALAADGGDQAPARRDRRPATRVKAPGANGQWRQADSNGSPQRSDPSRRNRDAANDPVESTDGADPFSPFVVAVPALGLSAIGALLVSRLRRRRRKPEASASAARPVTAAASRTPIGASSARETSESAPREGKEPALGYVSVRNRSANGQDLQKQTAAIHTVCRQRGLLLQRVILDVGQADATLSQRPGMRDALERLASENATCLVVAGLARLDCSTADLRRMIEGLRRREVRLVAVDDGLDTGTRVGRDAADKLAALCALGGQSDDDPHVPTPQGTEGPHGAKPPVSKDGPAVKARIDEMRAEGMTLQQIADHLNAEKIPALGGEIWRPSSVKTATENGSGDDARQESRRSTSPRKEGAIR